MKKNVYILLSMLVFSFAFVACEDEDKEAFNFHSQSENLAPYVRVINNSPIIDATALATAGFEGVVSAPANNVASWDLSVTKVPGNATASPLASITSFPSDVNITGAEIAAALGISIADMAAGDQLVFTATSTGTDGTTLSFAELAGDLSGQPEQRQAYNFSSFLGCPAFTAADLVGMWAITTDGFGGMCIDDCVFEIVTGPGENQVTFLDMFDHPALGGGQYDVILDFDPATGNASIATQPAWDSGQLGYGYGQGFADGSGFAFACADLITMTLRYTVGLGSFGQYAFVAQKQ